MRVNAGRWVCSFLVVSSVGFGSEPVFTRDRLSQPGPPFESLLEAENTARLLAILLDSGRSVVNENQPLIDDADKLEKGFTAEVFERQLAETFRLRAGVDLDDLEAANLPPQAKRLLAALVSSSKQVVADAQSEINRRGVAYKGFIPATFGARVADRFAGTAGVRLKQTSLRPRNPANLPDGFERAALQEFADPSYPRERLISEVTASNLSVRLMFPLYTTRRCLDCHGEPKGQPDRTGYPREGLRLGQNAGAISVLIPLEP
jgi:general secretion pathway protein A